jgi:LEA14-like dessication related protein
MKRKKNLALGIALLALLMGLVSCVEVAEPEVTFVNQTVDNISLEAVDLGLHFDVKNPNPIGIDRADLDYTLSLNNQKLTGGVAPDVSLPANKTSRLSLPLEINYLNIFKTVTSLSDAVTQGQAKLPYALDGKMTFYIFSVPVKVPVKVQGELPLPRVPDISIANIKLDKYDWASQQLIFSINLNVKNSNDFALPINELIYTLNLNNTAVAQAETKTFNKTALPGKTTPVSVQLALNTASLGNALMQAIQGQSVNYSLIGNLDTGGLAVPFSGTGSVRR